VPSFNDLFPLGLEPYLIGGLLVGVGVGLIFLTTGLIAGASSFFSTTLSWFSGAAELRRPEYVASRGWRMVFALGLVAGAVLFTVLWNDGATWTTAVSPWRLALGGFLTGAGTRLSRGCTSGHGICGLSSFSLPSLLAVATFMGVAIATAFVVARAGVTP
jgi:uncharacterized membrane protein YedE/YeeE